MRATSFPACLSRYPPAFANLRILSIRKRTHGSGPTNKIVSLVDMIMLSRFENCSDRWLEAIKRRHTGPTRVVGVTTCFDLNLRSSVYEYGLSVTGDLI